MARHSYDFSIDCPLPSKRVFAALTDFTENRVLYFPNLSRSTYELVDQQDHTAVVKEGTGPFRTTEKYDWSTDGRIWSVVLDSTVLAPGSMTDIRVEPEGESRCRVVGHLERQYVGRRGRVLAVFVLLSGRSRFYRKLYIRTLKNVQKAGRRR